MESKRQKTFRPLRILPSVSAVLLLIVLLYHAILTASQSKVVRVVDGDTIKLRSADSKSDITILLVGIDAPKTSKKKNEAGQPFSQKSSKYLSSLVLNKSVQIKSYGIDRYGRTLGVVDINGTNINLEMVKAGLAEVYRGQPAKGSLLKS